MSFQFTCSCGRTYEASEDHIGTMFQCDGCGASMVVSPPNPGATASPATNPGGTSAASGASNPYQSPTGQWNHQRPPIDEKMIRLPGIFLAIGGGLSVVGALVILAALLAQMMGFLDAQGQEAAEIVFGLVFYAVMFVLSIVVLWGGISMARRRNYGLAMTATIMGMIPCVGPCFGCSSIPFAIWALVILLKPEVKAVFEANRYR